MQVNWKIYVVLFHDLCESVHFRYDSKASASESSAEDANSEEDRKKKPVKKAKTVKEGRHKKEVKAEGVQTFNLILDIHYKHYKAFWGN